MDDSLRFKVQQNKAKEKTNSQVEKDYRGVNCPMNFVKTKLTLETMEIGEQLTILLDDGEPIENVPNSVKMDGHDILSQEKQSQGHWKVIIKKK